MRTLRSHPPGPARPGPQHPTGAFASPRFLTTGARDYADISSFWVRAVQRRRSVLGRACGSRNPTSQCHGVSAFQQKSMQAKGILVGSKQSENTHVLFYFTAFVLREKLKNLSAGLARFPVNRFHRNYFMGYRRNFPYNCCRLQVSQLRMFTNKATFSSSVGAFANNNCLENPGLVTRDTVKD